MLDGPRVPFYVGPQAQLGDPLFVLTAPEASRAPVAPEVLIDRLAARITMLDARVALLEQQTPLAYWRRFCTWVQALWRRFLQE